MTLEIDLDRVAAVTAQLERHLTVATTIDTHLVALARRMDLTSEAAGAIAACSRLTERLRLAALLLTRRAERASVADTAPASPARAGELEHRSFAGGTVLCSAVQVASPIPARPSTHGATGVIDTAGVARRVGAVVDAAATPVRLAGRAAPVASIAGALADTVLCRLRVGSGAPISTRTTVNERGQQVYEGSRSEHRHQDRFGVPLHPDPVRRDAQMWHSEHTNEFGRLLVPYPGYPAYEVNAR